MLERIVRSTENKQGTVAAGVISTAAIAAPIAVYNFSSLPRRLALRFTGSAENAQKFLFPIGYADALGCGIAFAGGISGGNPYRTLGLGTLVAAAPNLLYYITNTAMDRGYNEPQLVIDLLLGTGCVACSWLAGWGIRAYALRNQLPAAAPGGAGRRGTAAP